MHLTNMNSNQFTDIRSKQYNIKIVNAPYVTSESEAPLPFKQPAQFMGATDVDGLGQE
jgi:hypothetical protein